MNLSAISIEAQLSSNPFFIERIDLDFQKSPLSDFIWTSRDFVARGRPLRGEIGRFATKKGSLRLPRGRGRISKTKYLLVSAFVDNNLYSTK